MIEGSRNDDEKEAAEDKVKALEMNVQEVSEVSALINLTLQLT